MFTWAYWAIEGGETMSDDISTPGSEPQPTVPTPPPPGTYGANAPAVRKNGVVFYLGAIIALLCGILIVVSSFMTWVGVADWSFTGWDFRELMSENGDNPFFNSFEVSLEQGIRPVFSGLPSLIAGVFILGSALLFLLVRKKSLAVLLLIFSLIAIGMAGSNTYSFMTIENARIGAGMIMFLAASIGAMLGGILSLVV
jgi:hypothetical protein